MSTKPHVISQAEWEEIGALEPVLQSWGFEDGKSFADFATDNIYGVKFNFHSGSPGYVGDLFILQGDTLTGDRPLLVIRDQSGTLDLCD